MKKRILKILIPVMAVLILALGLASPALAVTTAVVTVTGTPAYVAITISPTTYTINSDNSGSSVMAINTTYYSNPLGGTTAPTSTVADAACDFTITNTASIATDLTGNMSDGSGGSNPMTNVNGATAGASSYSAYAYYSGETFASIVLLKSSASTLGNFKSNLAATTNIKVGFQFSTQTGAWTGGTGSTYTLTITSTAH
jgi:hypothetical protein